MNQSDTAPVEEGESHYVEIEELGDEGDGIAYIEGFVVFVPEADPTDSVDIEIDSVQDSFATAEIIEQHD
jgi:predicted RNA-binding protein with TRAM domain